jgi:hypothetical protein
MPKRVVFSFDDRSLESLKRMQEQGRQPPPSPCPSCALRVTAPKAYKELIVRNPETGEERVIVIPDESHPTPTR